MIKNAKKKERERHLPDSRLQKSLEQKEAGEEVKYQIADESHSVG